MTARGDTHCPNPPCKQQLHGTCYPDVTEQYPGYPPGNYSHESEYRYGARTSSSVANSFTDVRYQYLGAQDSYIRPCRTMQQPDADSYTVYFPPPVVSRNKQQQGCCQRVLQSGACHFHTLLNVASPLKRLAQYCDPNPIPSKRLCVDQNAIPHSVQLNGYQRSLNIQRNCYLTVAENTIHHHQIYSTAPSINVDKLRAYHGQEKTCCQADNSGKHTYLSKSISKGGNSKACNETMGMGKLTARDARLYVTKICQLVLKYMPHLRPNLVKMYKARCTFFTTETCSELMSLIRNETERYVLAIYIKYKSEIHNIVNNTKCTQKSLQNKHRSSSEEYLANSSVEQNKRDPPSNTDNLYSDSTSSHPVSNSSKDVCGFHESSIPLTNTGTFSPTYSHSSNGSSGFPSSNSSERSVGDSSSFNSACTFLSESEFRDQTCESVKQNLHDIENMTPPMAVENVLPHPRVSYSGDTPNYDKLHLNPSSENFYTYPSQDARSRIAKNNPLPLGTLPHQTEIQSKLPCKTIPSLSQCAGHNEYFKQQATSIMKLPEAVSTQESGNEFSSTANISSNIKKVLQSPNLSFYPTKLPTVNPYEGTSRYNVTEDNSPIIPVAKYIQLPKESLHSKHGIDVPTTKLPTVYPRQTTSETTFHNDNSDLISNHRAIKLGDESIAQKPDAGISSSNLQQLATAEAKVLTDPFAVNPKPKSVECQKESIVQKPERICSKSNDFMESENDDINCFQVQPPKNHQPATNLSQNPSEGLPGMSSSPKEECITIDGSDDETDVITLDDETEDFTATQSLPKISSGFRVSGTTFATFTIDDDELEMTTQEFGIEMLDMFTKSELQI